MKSKYCNDCKYLVEGNKCKLYRKELNSETSVCTISGNIITIPYKCKGCIKDIDEKHSINPSVTREGFLKSLDETRTRTKELFNSLDNE